MVLIIFVNTKVHKLEGKGREKEIILTFAVITSMMPKPDTNLDYSIPGQYSVRDPIVPRRQCPAPEMGKLEILDHFSRRQYVPDDLCQLYDINVSLYFKNNIKFY